MFVLFSTGHSLRLSSWPLFALSHQWLGILCWQGIPGNFSKYALLGDDILIGEAALAEFLRTIAWGWSKPKSLLSDRGVSSRRNSEFTVVSYPQVKMIRSARHAPDAGLSKSWTEVSAALYESSWSFVDILQNQMSPHTGIATSLWPSLPVVSYHSWLGFPEGILITCYHMEAEHACVFVFSGLGSCEALCHWSRFEMRTPACWQKFSRVKACYCTWWYRARVDFSIPLESFSNPPAVCFRPDRKDQNEKFQRSSVLGPRPPESLSDSFRREGGQVDFRRPVISWYRSTQWLDKIERKLLWSCYGSGAERPLDW